MPNLTRRRVNDGPETWHIHYAGVQVGMIIERSGNPTHTDRWEWDCGFSARHIRERLIGARVVFRRNFLVVDTINLNRSCRLSREPASSIADISDPVDP